MKLVSTTLATLVAAGLAAAAIGATAEKGTILGTDVAAISSALTQDGLELVRYDRTADRIRVVATRNGERHLIQISVVDGSVIDHQAASTVPASDPVFPPEALAEKLAAQGYELRRAEIERNKLEVYATRDGRLWELKLDPATGAILTVEAED